MIAEKASFHDWREWRRLRAFELKSSGWSQRNIAAALGVTEPAVSQWMHAAESGGWPALISRTCERPGRRLTSEQEMLLPDLLWHGPEAYGFRGDVWTCSRVAHVIKWEFGVDYHKHHVARILRQIGWTPQVPITRAIQRDEAAVRLWQAEAWPNLKAMARKQHRTLIFVDESGFYLLPAIVKTYGPRGIRPVLDEWERWDHLSVMGGLLYPCHRLITLVRQKPLNGLHVVEFLKHLLLEVSGRVTVIWDRSPIHRRREVAKFVECASGRLSVEYLPVYAPDLNPIEQAWHYLKYVELRNTACRDIEELHMEFHLAVARLRRKRSVIRSFFEGSGLS